MSFRVNPNPMSDLLLGLMQNRKLEDDALNQLSSGKRINSLSDDPAAVAALVTNHAQSGAVDQYLKNLSSVQSSMQLADSTLSSVITALTRAITLGTEGATDTMSPDNRQAIAEEVRGILSQILNLANTSNQGTYLFAGTAVTTAPFVLDATSPSGVRYVGNTGVNNVEVGEGETLPINLPGSQIFSAAGADVFQALKDLADALQSGTNIDAANSEVQKAFQQVNTQRAFYGNSLSRLATSQMFLNQRSLQLKTAETSLIGADMAQAATNLTQAESALNATLAAGGKISQLSLLDYLR
ncbi:MAG TPA: flagellar hook-associated protein FlgL [Terriglobia bacterium]|nr:flagellar hook-associated protein FlgL [Terriglobia bacterium]